MRGSAAVVTVAEEHSAQTLALGPSTLFAALLVATTHVASAAQRCLVDDVLVTSVEPDHLEKLLAAEHRRALRRANRAPTAPGALRSAQPAPVRAARTFTAPALHAWETALRIGDAHFKSGPEVEIEGRKTLLFIYSPLHDEDGKPLPGELTLAADAELRPGAELSRLRWIVIEMKKWPGEYGATIAAGDPDGIHKRSAAPPLRSPRMVTSRGVRPKPNGTAESADGRKNSLTGARRISYARGIRQARLEIPGCADAFNTNPETKIPHEKNTYPPRCGCGLRFAVRRWSC